MLSSCLQNFDLVPPGEGVEELHLAVGLPLEHVCQIDVDDALRAHSRLVSGRRSCRQVLIQFLQQARELVAKDRVGLAEATHAVELAVRKVVRFDP